MKSNIFVQIAVIVFPFSTSGQLAEYQLLKNETKNSFTNISISQNKILELENNPNKISVPIQIKQQISEVSKVSILPNELIKYTFHVEIPYNSELNFILDSFELNKTDTLYIKDSKGRILQGPITYKFNNTLNRFVSMSFDPASVIIIEGIGKSVSHSFNRLRINSFNYFPKSAGEEEFCFRDINCPEGANWQNESHSVVHIVSTLPSNNPARGTGVLVNNKCVNGKLYVLTNFHLFEDDMNNNGIVPPEDPADLDAHLADDERMAILTSTYFKYNFIRPGCNNFLDLNNPSYVQTNSGLCNIVAVCPIKDLILLEITSGYGTYPSSPVTPYLVGWEKAYDAPFGGTLISHPKQNAQKISIDSDALTAPFQFNYSNDADGDGHGYFFTDLFCARFDNGSISGHGSSGGPIFDNYTHKLIGINRASTYTCPVQSATNPYTVIIPIAEIFNFCPGIANALDPLSVGAISCEGIYKADVNSAGECGTQSGECDQTINEEQFYDLTNNCTDYGIVGSNSCYQYPTCTFTDENKVINHRNISGGHNYYAKNSFTINENVLLEEGADVDFVALDYVEFNDIVIQANNVNLRVVTCYSCTGYNSSGWDKYGYDENQNNLFKLSTYTLHPNPHREQFTLSQTEEGYIKSYRLMDVMGKPLLTSLPAKPEGQAPKTSQGGNLNNNIVISTEGLAKGIYILQLETTEGMKAERVVKE